MREPRLRYYRMQLSPDRMLCMPLYARLVVSGSLNAVQTTLLVWGAEG